jgi:cell division protein FtsB
MLPGIQIIDLLVDIVGVTMAIGVGLLARTAFRQMALGLDMLNRAMIGQKQTLDVMHAQAEALRGEIHRMREERRQMFEGIAQDIKALKREPTRG